MVAKVPDLGADFHDCARLVHAECRRLGCTLARKKEGTARSRPSGTPGSARSTPALPAVSRRDEAVAVARDGSRGLLRKASTGAGPAPSSSRRSSTRADRDFLSLDLAGALVDLRDPRIAHVLLGRVVVHLAATTEHLDGIGGDLQRDVAGAAIGHGRVGPWSVAPCAACRHETPRVAQRRRGLDLRSGREKRGRLPHHFRTGSGRAGLHEDSAFGTVSRGNQLDENGFSSVTPVRSTSFVLRVTSVRSCSSAVAASMPSTKGSGSGTDRRAQRSAVARSIS